MTSVVRIRRHKGKIVQDCDVYIGRNMYMGGWQLILSDYKMAMVFLNATKEFAKKANCRSLLFCPEDIEEKKVDKLLKLGLSDYLDANTNLKSLHYKVKFLLKSLPEKTLKLLKV